MTITDFREFAEQQIRNSVVGMDDVVTLLHRLMTIVGLCLQPCLLHPCFLFILIPPVNSLSQTEPLAIALATSSKSLSQRWCVCLFVCFFDLFRQQ